MRPSPRLVHRRADVHKLRLATQILAWDPRLSGISPLPFQRARISGVVPMRLVHIVISCYKPSFFRILRMRVAVVS